MAVSYPIAESTEVPYREFVTRDEPTDCRQEIALQRTLLHNLMETIRVRSEADIDTYAADVALEAAKTLEDLGVPSREVEIIHTALQTRFRHVCARHVPNSLDAKVVVQVQKIISQIVVTGERMERIQRGRKMFVRIDDAAIAWIIRTFVIPFVPKDRLPALRDVARNQGVMPDEAA